MENGHDTHLDVQCVGQKREFSQDTATEALTPPVKVIRFAWCFSLSMAPQGGQLTPSSVQELGIPRDPPPCVR